jgi:hypothetical protein
MTHDFSIVNSYFGWGDPGVKRRGIWFIGIEEAAGYSKDVEKFDKELAILKLLTNPHYSFTTDFAKENNGNKRTIPNIESRIVTGLRGGNWEHYRDQTLCHELSGVFHANIYPLGKASLSNSHSTNVLARFGFTTEEDYKAKVKKDRFKALYQFWVQHKPQATICFGYKGLDDFQELFQLSQCSFQRDFNFYVDLKNRILLTRHFSRAFSKVMEEQVVKVLKEWNVTLPA